MNCYFLMEDSKSFLKLLPQWLSYMGIHMTRAVDIDAVTEDCYVLQSGQGVRQLITHELFNTIDEICDHPGRIDWLVVILDSEEMEAEEREQQVWDKIREKYDPNALPCKIKILVTKRCLETWLLGCPGQMPEDASKYPRFYPFFSYYDVEKLDPEKMEKPEDWQKSIARYHYQYLYQMFLCRGKRYTKDNIRFVSDQAYFEGIRKRAEQIGDLATFSGFLSFFQNELAHGS